MMQAAMSGSFEFIDHTGDIGLRVRADTLTDLFTLAARGMYEILAEAPDLRPQRTADIVVEGETDELLRGWLAELLYRFSVDEMIFCGFDINVAPGRLTAQARGQKMDRAIHAVRTELKAVTYHGLSVRREGAEWVAEVIFDV